MIISLIIRKMTRGRVNRWALVLIADIVVSTVADLAGHHYEAMGSRGIVGNYISNVFTLLGTTLTSVIFCGYLFAMIGIWHIIRERKALAYLYVVPALIISALVLFVNPFTGIIFRIDGNGVYHRGPLFYVLYAIAYTYAVVAYVKVIKYRNLFNLRKMFSVLMVYGMMVFASIVQALNPDHYVQMYFTAASFLLMVFGIQSPEERMHGTTGLYSMNAFVQDIHKYYALNTPIGVTMSVMTNYNTLIEMFGFFSVQTIIVDTAKKLEKWAREARIDADLYYLGGGRFAVICDERYEARHLTIAQEINSVLASEVEIGEMSVKVMNNVCFIACPKDIDNPEFLLAFDGGLEAEAYSGELRYAEKLFDKKRFELRHDIMKIINRAFEEHLFTLHYQPVYSVRENRFVRAEAFLRLNDQNFGQIRPDLLISEAEKTNSIHAITAFVIEEVCRFLSMPEFLLLGFEYVEINLSPVQCMWSELLTVLLSTIRNYNVQPKSICFNITDVDSQDSFEKMKNNIDALAQVGFVIFMDDFGAGIFEVQRIARMPLTGIKFDRSFVKEGLKEGNSVVFEGSLKMIEDLGLETVAVGVENEEMEKRLTDLNCEYLQGYQYCRPLEKKELIRFILMR